MCMMYLLAVGRGGLRRLRSACGRRQALTKFSSGHDVGGGGRVMFRSFKRRQQMLEAEDGGRARKSGDPPVDLV